MKQDVAVDRDRLLLRTQFLLTITPLNQLEKWYCLPS